MATASLGLVLRQVRLMASGEGLADATDGQLLERFRARQEEAAFAALLHRHGPMVLGVARRVLRQAQDAEDVFQAAFLLLARKAASIRQRESVGSWLHGVAYRLAVAAKGQGGRRQTHERRAGTMRHQRTKCEAAWQELEEALDQALGQLPEKYREAVVLCCLQGKLQEEAARQLGCPLGTVRSRLARGRELLRKQLASRGVLLSAGALATFLAASAASAALPAAEALRGVVRASLPAATGKAVAGAVSPRVAALLEGATKAMATTKAKAVVALIVTLGVLAAGAGVCARQALSADNPAAAKESGARTQAEDRDPKAAEKRARTDLYGDPLPAGAVARLGTVRFRSAGRESPIAFLPGDKALVAVGQEDRVVSVWEATTGKEVRRSAKMGLVFANALSSDGKILAVVTGSEKDHTIRLFDASTGKDLRRLEGHRALILALAFAADGRTLVSGGEDQTVRIWDVAAGKEVLRIDEGHSVAAVAIALDGKTLAAVSGSGSSTVHLRETATGKELRSFQGDGMPIFQVVFSPDGKTLAAVEPVVDVPESKVHLWDVADGKHRLLPATPAHRWTCSIAFSPDGKTLATANAETFQVWDVDAGKRLERFEGKACYTAHLAFSGDGKTLASSGEGALRLWEVATGQEIPAPGDGHQGPVQALAFLADGKTLVTAGGDHTLRRWEAATGKQVRRLPVVGGVFRPWFAAEGKLLAVPVEKEVCLCEPATGKELRRFSYPAHVRHVALTPDGKTLAVATGWGGDTLRLVDAATGKERLVRRYPNGVQVLAFSPDGAVLAVGLVCDRKTLPDGSVRLLDAATGGEVHRLRLSDNATAFAFSPDGKTLATPDLDGVNRLWEVATGKERAQWPEAERPEMAFSPDGRVLALGDGDGTLHLCLAATGKVLRRLRGHRSQITSLAFSADGKTLATGSRDTTALIWDVSGMLERKGEPAGELGARQLEARWTDLAGDDAAKAYRAIQELAAAPGQAVPFLKARLRPVSVVELKQLAPLLADLDSDDFAVREKAAAELEKLGAGVETPVRQALAGKPSLEVRRRLENLLEKLDAATPNQLRMRRAVEALELAGGAEARRLLKELAGGAPEARLTREAKASQERLERRPSPTP